MATLRVPVGGAPAPRLLQPDRLRREKRVLLSVSLRSHQSASSHCALRTMFVNRPRAGVSQTRGGRAARPWPHPTLGGFYSRIKDFRAVFPVVSRHSPNAPPGSLTAARLRVVHPAPCVLPVPMPTCRPASSPARISAQNAPPVTRAARKRAKAVPGTAAAGQICKAAQSRPFLPSYEPRRFCFCHCRPSDSVLKALRVNIWRALARS